FADRQHDLLRTGCSRARRSEPSERLLSPVRCAWYGALFRWRGTVRIRQGRHPRTVGREGDRPISDSGDAQDGRRRGPFEAALSVSTGGALQGDGKHRRRSEFCVWVGSMTSTAIERRLRLLNPRAFDGSGRIRGAAEEPSSQPPLLVEHQVELPFGGSAEAMLREIQP